MADTAAAKIALLPDRGVIALTGPDAVSLLQGVITNDMDLLATQPALHTALLTPQGKILVDFFVIKNGDGLLLDCPRDKVPDLIKRLTMYLLRAKVEIADVSDKSCITAVWGVASDPNDSAANATSTIVCFGDPRNSAMGFRSIFPVIAEVYEHAFAVHGMQRVDASDYHERRISLGVPEGGRDYVFGDTFAHEALLDQLHGVSFTKGCYVGQEIVSRMQHRGTARKRIVRVVAPGALPKPGAEIAAGETVIGTLGSTNGHEGLALIRLDRAAEALAKGITLAAGPSPIQVEIPPWATFKLG